ncbi:MAG: TolC family protein [Deltaproteobacteria bacterium]|nr:TolC family protein [Deltaproteobacteria bacterium]
MRNQKVIFLLLLFTLLLTGCAQQSTSGIHSEKSHDLNEFHIESAVRPSSKHMEDNVSVTEPNGILTLGQVLTLTLLHNPELKVFSLETRAAEARELQAGLWPNPELEIEAENVGGTGELSGFDSAETTIQLSQLIELGGKSQKRRKVASFEKELAGLDYQNKRLEIFSDAAKAFISILKAQGNLELSNELLKLSRESFETVAKRVDAGKDSPIEKTRASVALSKMEVQNLKAQRNLEYSRKRLATFWGQDKPQFEQAAGNLEDIKPLPTLEGLSNQLKLNPEYTRWEAEIKKNQAVLNLEGAKTIGDITIGAGVQRFNETDDNAFVFGVSIPLPISDNNQGAKQEAILNLAKSREAQRVAWFKLQNEFNQTYQEFANSYSQATSLKSDVLPSAVEMFNAATRAYQEGKVDYLNVMDAQRTLFDVKNEYIESLAACHMARTDIERFIGSQIQTVNISESE